MVWGRALYLLLLAGWATQVIASIILPRTLPSTAWHHEDDHPVHGLFRRQSGNSGTVGSPTWVAAYPSGTPDISNTPPEWTNALNAAVAAGKIPNIPTSTSTGGNPAYPAGVDPMSSGVCSGTEKCRIPGDIWDAPDGHIGVGFDDGPCYQSSDVLYDFLQANSQPATHFMIGVAILQDANAFLHAFNNGDDIAVHTYTHPYMTTLSNEELIAQFGWTMQIIYDSTGGRVPKFWRPPMGDTDMRVHAIASEIFGLTTIMWNQDSEDWRIASGAVTAQQVATQLAAWVSGPKSPGLIILEHELTNTTVQEFINIYPMMKSQGWNLTSVTRLVPSAIDNVTGQSWWNAKPGNKGRVANSGILNKGESAPPALPSASSTISSASLSTSSSSTSSSTAPASSTQLSSANTKPSKGGAEHSQLSSSLVWTPVLSVLILLLGSLY